MFGENVRAMAVGLVLAAAAGSMAQAAPVASNLSGTASLGQVVTINGSGFGTKASAGPTLWDDFEGGTNGAVIQNTGAKIGKWDSGAGSDVVVYSTAKPRTGTKSSYHDFIKNYNVSLAKNMPFSRLYMDFWIVADYLDIPSRNWKPWRLYGNNDSLQLDYVWLCDGQLMNRVQDSAGWSVGDWGGNRYSNGTWMHVQLVYQQSSPGTADGVIRHYIDSAKSGLDSGAIVTQMKSDQFNQIRIGHYWDRGAVDNCKSNAGARIYVDDVYIDTSWARVELGNASTYAASKHREIQVPTAWNDGAVSFKFNPGTFTTGSTVYLYVTDANNNTSAGIPVKIGTAGVAPNPPASVTVE